MGWDGWICGWSEVCFHLGNLLETQHVGLCCWLICFSRQTWAPIYQFRSHWLTKVTLMRLNWWDSGWQRYQLNNNRWWELDNLRQCGDQIWNQYKWRHLVTNFASNGSFGEMKYKNKADAHLSYMFGNVRQCLAQAARQAFQLQLIGHTHCCQHHHQGGV